MAWRGRKERPAGLGWRGWSWRLGLATVGGCGVFLAFPTFDLAPLAWITLVPTLFAVRGTTPRQHLLLGLWAGTVTNAGGFHWIGGMLMDFGHLGWWPAAALTLLLVAYQGLVFALWLWLLARLQRLWPDLGIWLLAPLTFTAAEAAIWFLFPWYYANSQHWVLPVIQVCELGGVSLLTFLLVLTNGALFEAACLWRQRRRAALGRLALALAVPALLFVYGLVRMAMVEADMQAAPKLTIGMVEADVGIWEKEDPRTIEDNLVRHQRLSIELERRGAELIVWPETSYYAPLVLARTAGGAGLERYRHIPHDVAYLPQSTSPPPEHASEDRSANTPLADRVAVQRGFSTPLLFGALTLRPNPDNRSVRHRGVDYLNTALLLDGQGNVLGSYDKVYPLMFGEYVPWADVFPVFYSWFPEAGDLTPGDRIEVLPFGAFRIGVMICYEDIIPAFIRRIAALRPNILINVTNDAWFGKTAEPYLHLALAVFRTVESRLTLLRSTNTGVSVFVDPVGRILSQTSLTGAETLLWRVPLMEGGTPYQTLGDWPAWGCLAAVPLLWLGGWRRRRS